MNKGYSFIYVYSRLYITCNNYISLLLAQCSTENGMKIMKRASLQIAFVTPLVIGGLSGCTTVDLSQIAIEQTKTVSKAPDLNIVERASHSLTSQFRTKGWSKSGPDEKTKTATNVLLNGIRTDEHNAQQHVVTISREQLGNDLIEANKQVVQATKAAEVFLAMAEGNTGLDSELAQLERALLSSREAESHFNKVIEITGGFMNRRRLKSLSKSVNNLKIVTDAYGDRIRQQIAAQALVNRS